jgi:hypothetical protein
MHWTIATVLYWALALAPLPGPQGVVRIPGPGGAGGASNFAFVTNSATGCEIGFIGLPASAVCTYALHVNPGTKNLETCHAFWHNTGAQTASMASTHNGTFTPIGPQANGTGANAGFSSQVFQVLNTVSGADTVTLTISSSTTIGGWECGLYTYSNGPLTVTDGTAISGNATASGTTVTFGTITTANPNGIIIAHCMGIPTGACAVGSGFTARNDTAACAWNGSSCSATNRNFNADAGDLIEDKFNTAPGSQSGTFQVGSGIAIVYGMVAY